jgi:holo-[acyl-carrier protein] synthase
LIVGMGLDVIEVGRIAPNIEREAYLRKVFTPAEIEDCHRSLNAAERFAGKFAAKEAFMKALGAGLRQGIWFSQIEVLNEDSGQPHLAVSGTSRELLASRAVATIHLSISHTAELAIAIVILEK